MMVLPCLPEGVPDPVPLRPLWGNVVVDCTEEESREGGSSGRRMLDKTKFYISKVLQSISTCGSQ